MNKSLVIRSIVVSAIAIVVTYGVITPQTINADLTNSNKATSATLIKNGHLTVCKLDKSSYEVVKTIKLVVTGYSSTPDQTDDTPFITASGAHVADGIIAANFSVNGRRVPFGTLVRIPGLYGNKVFVVQDRMNSKYSHNIDIWFSSRNQARNLGAKVTNVEIIES